MRSSRRRSQWRSWRVPVEQIAAASAVRTAPGGENSARDGTIRPCIVAAAKAGESMKFFSVGVTVTTSRNRDLYVLGHNMVDLHVARDHMVGRHVAHRHRWHDDLAMGNLGQSSVDRGDDQS